MAFTLETQQPEGRIMSGADAYVIEANTNPIGYASDMSVNGNWNLQGIRVLGKFEYLDLKSMGFDGSASVGTFLLKNPLEEDVAGRLQDQGWQPGEGGKHLINEAGLLTFQINSVINNLTLLTIIGMKIGGFNYTIPQTGLITKGTDWQYLRLVPGTFSA